MHEIIVLIAENIIRGFPLTTLSFYFRNVFESSLNCKVLFWPPQEPQTEFLSDFKWQNYGLRLNAVMGT